MRRVAGYLCMFVGALALVLGILARPVLYASLARVELGQRWVTTAAGEGLSVLRTSQEGMSVIRDVTVETTRNVIGIPGKSTGNNALWQTTTQSTALGHGDLNYSQETVSFERTSGEATNCCGDVRSAGDLADPSRTVPVVHRGLVFKFPFGTQRRTYSWWDGELGRAEPARYVRSETVLGLDTFVFRQRSGPEPFGPNNGVQVNLPGSLFGADLPVTATSIYEVVRTFWVEPHTGAVIDLEERIDKRLEASGYSDVPILRGTQRYTDATVQRNVADWRDRARLLAFVAGPLTWLGVLSGVVLLGVGGFLALGHGANAGTQRQGSGLWG